MVDNSGTIYNGPVTVLKWHLIICAVGVGYLDESATGAFNETVGILYFGGGCNDIGLVVVDPSVALPPPGFRSKLAWKQ